MGRPGEISMCTRTNCACTDIAPLACTTESDTGSGAEAGHHQLAQQKATRGRAPKPATTNTHRRVTRPRGHRASHRLTPTPRAVLRALTVTSRRRASPIRAGAGFWDA